MPRVAQLQTWLETVEFGVEGLSQQIFYYGNIESSSVSISAGVWLLTIALGLQLHETAAKWVNPLMEHSPKE